MFACGYYEIFKYSFFMEHLRWMLLYIFIINSEHISHFVLVFVLLTLNM